MPVVKTNSTAPAATAVSSTSHQDSTANILDCLVACCACMGAICECLSASAHSDARREALLAEDAHRHGNHADEANHYRNVAAIEHSVGHHHAESHAEQHAHEADHESVGCSIM